MSPALYIAAGLAALLAGLTALNWYLIHTPPEGMTQEEYHRELSAAMEQQARDDLFERFH